MSANKPSDSHPAPGEATEVQAVHHEHEDMEKAHHHHDAHVPKSMQGASHLFQEDCDGNVLARLLLPRPTTDPKDPLTWRSLRKYLALFSISYFIFLSYYITSSLNPILVDVALHFDVSVTRASWLISFNVLFLGIGNLLWIPLAQKIGKRPIILVSTAMFFASSIWCAVADSFGSMLGARIIQGLGASSSEVLAPAVVADLFFLHERGLWVGLAMFNITFGSALGGIFAGLVANANPDWRWVFWMNTILTGVCFLVAILFSPETNFRRPPENEGGEGMHPNELTAIRSRSGHTWTQSLGVTGWYDRENSMAELFSRPWLTLRWPAVPWASLLIGLNLGAYVMLATANSALFPAEYGYSSLGVGNIAIGYLISGIFGCLAGGPLSDWLSAAITKRRGGYFLPEFRLWCLVLPGIFVPIGLMMWGGGLQNHLSPFVAIVGAAVSCATTNAVAATCITYIVDCYRPFSGETITIFTAFKNTVTFGLTFAVFPWLEQSGPVKMAGYLILIQGVVFVSAIPMYMYGHRLRNWSSKYGI